MLTWGVFLQNFINSFHFVTDIKQLSVLIAFPSRAAQFDQMASQAIQYNDELRNTKGEIADINRMISRLQSEIEVIKSQVRNVLYHLYFNQNPWWLLTLEATIDLAR